MGNRNRSQAIIGILSFGLSCWFLYYFLFIVDKFNDSIYGLIAYLVGMITAPFLYTLGKVIFGKIAGFKVIYHRIFNHVTVLSNGEKIKIKKPQTRQYSEVRFGGKGIFIFSVIGGIILLNLILAGLIVGFFLVKNTQLKPVFMGLAIDVLYVLVNQAFPATGENKNDGGKLFLAITNKNYRKLFKQRLITDYELAMGERYKDLTFDFVDYVPDFLYLAYLIDYSYCLLDSDDMDGFFQIVDSIDRLMFTTDRGLLEQMCFLTIAKGLFKHDTNTVRRNIGSIMQQTRGDVLDTSLELSYLNFYLLRYDYENARKIRELLVNVLETVPSNATKAILKRELNMMHPDEYQISYESDIVENKKYAYTFFKGNKIYLLDLVMYHDAFVDNKQDNGYIYGAYNSELTIQTEYGLLSAKNVIYCGAFFTADEFIEKFSAKGEVLK